MSEKILLPAAIEQELDVLGACIDHGAAWWRAVVKITGGDISGLFHDRKARMVAEVLEEISARDMPMTSATVADMLNRSDLAEELFLPSVQDYLANLKVRTSLFTTKALREAAAALDAKRTLREQIVGLEQLASKARTDELDPNDVASLVRDLATKTAGGAEGLRSFGEVIDEMESEASAGVRWRVTTGIKDMDSALRGGYEPGRFYVFGARPKVGKTSLILNSVLASLTAGAAVLMVSLEINAGEFYSKVLSSQAMVPQTQIQALLDGEMELDDFSYSDRELIVEAKEALKNSHLYPMFVRDIKNGVNSVVAAIMEMRNKYPDTPIVVYVDYLQLLANSSIEHRAHEVGRCSRELKLAALDNDVAVVALSQLSRAAAEGGMPSPHHLKESGDVEQDADVVGLLNRPALQDEAAPPSLMDIHIALSRVGPSTWVKAGFYPEYQVVTDYVEATSSSEGDQEAVDVVAAAKEAPLPADDEPQVVSRRERRGGSSRQVVEDDEVDQYED